MSVWIPPLDAWVPYSGEPLTCAACGSPNTVRAKTEEPKRDVLVCLECDHITDRWKRTEGVT
jgi:hypothetical protein